MPEPPPDDDPTTGVDPTDLGAVADVLYRLPPDGFVAARAAFVKAARAAGDRDVARQVQALGRPTRAAWVLNRLARDSPEVVAGLVELGTELAAAQAELDATALRELSDRRRALVRDVSRQAFDLVGEAAPPAALAVEVQDTLTAAVVDPTVGEALQGGALLKAARASGFGPAGPELAAVPRPRLRAVPAGSTDASAPTPAPRRASSGKAGTSAGKAGTSAGKAGTSAGKTGTSAGKVGTSAGTTAPAATDRRREAAAEQRAAAARAEAERRAAEKRERVAAADRALVEAQAGLAAARDGEKAAQEQVRILREQVRDADRALGDAGLAVREARATVREAERRRRETR